MIMNIAVAELITDPNEACEHYRTTRREHSKETELVDDFDAD